MMNINQNIAADDLMIDLSLLPQKIFVSIFIDFQKYENTLT
jgi:hypothetical protein